MLKFLYFNHRLIYPICDVMMNISTWDQVHLWIYPLNHNSLKSPNLINWFLTTWRIGARFHILLQFRNLLQLLNNQWCQGSSVSLFWKGELGTIKNNKCQLLKMARSCCHFHKIIKGPGTSFQSPAISQENIRNVCHTAH